MKNLKLKFAFFSLFAAMTLTVLRTPENTVNADISDRNCPEPQKWHYSPDLGWCFIVGEGQYYGLDVTVFSEKYGIQIIFAAKQDGFGTIMKLMYGYNITRATVYNTLIVREIQAQGKTTLPYAPYTCVPTAITGRTTQAGPPQPSLQQITPCHQVQT